MGHRPTGESCSQIEQGKQNIWDLEGAAGSLSRKTDRPLLCVLTSVTTSHGWRDPCELVLFPVVRPGLLGEEGTFSGTASQIRQAVWLSLPVTGMFSTGQCLAAVCVMQGSISNNTPATSSITNNVSYSSFRV